MPAHLISPTDVGWLIDLVTADGEPVTVVARYTLESGGSINGRTPSPTRPRPKPCGEVAGCL